MLNLSEEQKAKGVITTSAGNHAQALAYQSLKLGIEATVVMPLQAPIVKVSNQSVLQKQWVSTLPSIALRKCCNWNEWET